MHVCGHDYTYMHMIYTFKFITTGRFGHLVAQPALRKCAEKWPKHVSLHAHSVNQMCFPGGFRRKKNVAHAGRVQTALMAVNLKN